MNLLVDSHVLVWAMVTPERLGPNATAMIEDADEVWISMASLWELAIKFVNGRMAHSPAQLVFGAAKLGLSELELGDRHLIKLPDVRLPHRDPFDRMLIAQAEADGLTLVTADRALLASPYATLDARH